MTTSSEELKWLFYEIITIDAFRSNPELTEESKKNIVKDANTFLYFMGIPGKLKRLEELEKMLADAPVVQYPS